MTDYKNITNAIAALDAKIEALMKKQTENQEFAKKQADESKLQIAELRVCIEKTYQVKARRAVSTINKKTKEKKESKTKKKKLTNAKFFFQYMYENDKNIVKSYFTEEQENKAIEDIDEKIKNRPSMVRTDKRVSAQLYSIITKDKTTKAAIKAHYDKYDKQVQQENTVDAVKDQSVEVKDNNSSKTIKGDE